MHWIRYKPNACSHVVMKRRMIAAGCAAVPIAAAGRAALCWRFGVTACGLVLVSKPFRNQRRHTISLKQSEKLAFRCGTP